MIIVQVFASATMYGLLLVVYRAMMIPLAIAVTAENVHKWNGTQFAHGSC